MNEEIKQEWVRALRSGEYKQGHGELRTKDGKFCCLGVLCDLYSKKNNKPWFLADRTIDENCSYYTIHGAAECLPKEVRVWADIAESDPVVKAYGPEDRDCAHLSYLNDNGEPFVNIAKLIEEQL